VLLCSVLHRSELYFYVVAIFLCLLRKSNFKTFLKLSIINGVENYLRLITTMIRLRFDSATTTVRRRCDFHSTLIHYNFIRFFRNKQRCKYM